MTAMRAAVRKTEDVPAAGSARGSSFYTAMRIMPKAQRQAMYEIYQFCRQVDDIADEQAETSLRLEQLQQWRNDIALVYQAKPPLKLSGLAEAVKDFSLRQQDFLAVINGMEMDVNGPILAPKFATLELYCDRVASAVGRLSVKVFGLDETGGLLLSHHLGFALQLTNILRDVDEDAAIGRLYLPEELLKDARIIGHDPLTIAADPAIADVCGRLAIKALGHFSEADTLMKQYERKFVRTPRVMSQAYHAILNALIERGFAFPRKPVHLSKLRLGYILMRNVLF